VAGTGLPRPGEPAGARPGADSAGGWWDVITAADLGPAPAAGGGISRSGDDGDRDTVPAAAPEDGDADGWFAALGDTGAEKGWGLLAAPDRIAQGEGTDPEELQAALAAVFADV
jgi:hypothetical protein